MPGRLASNLRKGHIAEDIGIGVLRAFSAVATARHQDDIGVDAFAVLLHQDGKFLYARSTFGVQFKAQSVDEIFYESEQMSWFMDLDVPLFFARVDASDGSVEFFSPTRWNSLLPSYEFSQMRFLFEQETAVVSDQVAIVGMWPPILRCSEIESRTDEFASKAYKLLNDWTEFEARNIELRKFKIYRSATWETGGKPRLFFEGSESMVSDKLEHMERARPVIDKLSFHALGYEDLDVELLKSFIYIHKWYISEGIEAGALSSPEVIESYLGRLES